MQVTQLTFLVIKCLSIEVAVFPVTTATLSLSYSQSYSGAGILHLDLEKSSRQPSRVN